MSNEKIWPVTFGGKAFTAVIALIGVAIIAVPAGMMASALTKVARKNADEARTRYDKEGGDGVERHTVSSDVGGRGSLSA